MDNQQASIANRVYSLLTLYDNFTQFSNEAWIGDEQNVDSIEALHDLIHGITGNDGHMSFLEYAAFDPLFHLLHVNLDRFFAIFQALHPDTYVEPMPAKADTFTIVKGSVQDAQSRKQALREICFPCCHPRAHTADF
jgi:tyrosinase